MLSNRPKVRAAGTWRLAVIPRHAQATPRPRLEPRTTPPRAASVPPLAQNHAPRRTWRLTPPHFRFRVGAV